MRHSLSPGPDFVARGDLRRRVCGRVALVAAGLVVSLSTSACGSRGEEGVAASRDTLESLRARAASILPEVEAFAALPATGPVALGVRTREELEIFLVDQLERQLPPEKARAVGRVYARLGLLPPDLELEPLLRSLLLEQVVGYYDPARDTLYVVAGVDTALVETVLAHELVHALQDQHQDLDSLMRANLDRNDRATAAQAGLEGHATLAMLEWQLARLSGGALGLDDLPELSGLAEGDLMEAAGLEMPALASAPRIVRESLLFPYIGGLRFARARNELLGSRSAPLGDAMPESTEQVLHPERSLGAGRDDPLALRLPSPPPDGWRGVRADGLGELELRIWLEELVGRPGRAARAAEGWDGDRYRLLARAEEEALVWVTAWDSATEASEFAGAARDALVRRYPEGGRQIAVREGAVAGVATVTILDLPEGAPLDRFLAAARPEIGEGP